MYPSVFNTWSVGLFMTNSYSSGHTEPLATDRRPVSGEKLMKALAEASYV